MEKRPHEDRMRDVSARQRNTVFPDTVQNEARFWRNAMAGKHRFTIGQVVGFGLIFVAMMGVFWSAIYWKLRGSSAGGSLFDRLIGNFGDWVILFGIFGLMFLLLRWRIRRAPNEAEAKHHTRPGSGLVSARSEVDPHN
jgi:hypothetical protein